MEKDEKILEYISNKQDVTQRELAIHTGLSLGNVNMIVRSMVKKGLIKIEHLKPSTLRYILTPQGFTEKTLRTYRYILDSVKNVMKLKQELIQIIEQYGYTVYLYGDQDQIREMLVQMTAEGSLRQIKWIENVEELPGEQKEVFVVVWQVEKESELANKNLQYVNLLSNISD